MSEGYIQASAVVTSARLGFLANGNGLITRLPDNPNSKMPAPARTGVFFFQVPQKGRDLGQATWLVRDNCPALTVKKLSRVALSLCSQPAVWP